MFPNSPQLNKYERNALVRHELILESIKEGVCVIDQEARISFINQSAARLLGQKAEELIGQSFDAVFFGKKLKDAETPVDFVLAEGEAIQVNSETFSRQDKSTFTAEYSCVPLRENGHTVGAVITFANVGERRALEDAISGARDAALDAAREKADFLANMSHEIRTPLNGIIGISEILAETNLSIAQKDYLETLKTSAYLLLNIVDEILDYSKIEAGKLELEEVDFDLREIVGETIKLFLPQAVKRRNKLEFEIAETVEVRRRGDAGRLRQVLHNLLGNAVKFTADGQVSLKIFSLPDDILRFEIRDTGIGIEADKLSEIFQPFSQADSSTTRQFGGTGLGLTISRKITQMMNGDIGVESTPGRGSKFWFTAKFEKQAMISLEPADSPQNFPQDRKDVKILVVDDNPVNLEVALGRLRQLGLTADTAENGLEALETAAVKNYDLILLDCRMPKMDGFAAAQQIRALSSHSANSKIIAITASVRADERRRCFAAGMNDYLSKPLTLESLAEILKKHLMIKLTIPSSTPEKIYSQHPLANLIDEKTLRNFIEIEKRGEKNFAREMLSLFLAHSETQISEMKSAFVNRDSRLVKNKSHALRGSSANIGLHDLSQAFTKLEEVVEKDWTEAEKLLHGIIEEFFRLKTKVSQLSEIGEQK